MVTSLNDPAAQRGGIAVRDYTASGALAGTRAGAYSLGQRLAHLNYDRMARRLGWLSVGLGLMQVLTPRRVQRLAGVRRDFSGLIRLMGARELAHGLLIFMQPRPHTGVWSRVVGDGLDLGVLAAAFGLPRADKTRLAALTAGVAALTAADVFTAVQLGRARAEERRYSALTRRDLNRRSRSGAFQVTKSITINRSPEVLYRFWRSFENLPQFMFHLQNVEVLDNRRSRWTTKAPAGMEVSWEAEITDDRPNELIAWQSRPGAQVPNSGTVRFEPGAAGRGTVVRVQIEYHPPGGALGKLVAGLFGEAPAQQVAGDLRRFKQVMEIGEVVRSEGSPKGFGQKAQRPARPQARGNGGHKPRPAESELQPDSQPAPGI